MVSVLTHDACTCATLGEQRVTSRDSEILEWAHAKREAFAQDLDGEVVGWIGPDARSRSVGRVAILDELLGKFGPREVHCDTHGQQASSGCDR